MRRRVDVATLIELTQVLIGGSENRDFPGKRRFAREKSHEVASLADGDNVRAIGKQAIFVGDDHLEGLEAVDRDKVIHCASSHPDAGRGLQDRGG